MADIAHIILTEFAIERSVVRLEKLGALRFPLVIVPLAELAPEMHHPISGQTLAAIAAELMCVNLNNSKPPLLLVSG